MKSIDTIEALTKIPADDGSFKSALERATANQVRIAINYMEQSGGGDEGRIEACRGELMKREKAILT